MKNQWPNGNAMVVPRWLARVVLWVFLVVASTSVGVSAWAIQTMLDVSFHLGQADQRIEHNAAGLEGVTKKAADNGEAIAMLRGRHQGD